MTIVEPILQCGACSAKMRLKAASLKVLKQTRCVKCRAMLEIPQVFKDGAIPAEPVVANVLSLEGAIQPGAVPVPPPQPMPAPMPAQAPSPGFSSAVPKPAAISAQPLDDHAAPITISLPRPATQPPLTQGILRPAGEGAASPRPLPRFSAPSAPAAPPLAPPAPAAPTPVMAPPPPAVPPPATLIPPAPVPLFAPPPAPVPVAPAAFLSPVEAAPAYDDSVLVARIEALESACRVQQQMMENLTSRLAQVLQSQRDAAVIGLSSLGR